MLRFLLAASVLALPALADNCYALKWNLDQVKPDMKVTNPVTHFPLNHAKVANNVCGGPASADRRIQATEAWSTQPNDADCQSGPGSKAFYAYNNPTSASANTGGEVYGGALGYFVTDSDEVTSFVLTLSKPSAPTPGSITFSIDSPDLAGLIDNPFIMMDDPDEAGGWDSATGKANALSWGWSACCTDGMVFGPLPEKNYCFNLKASVWSGLDSFVIGGYNSVTGELDLTTIPLEVAREGVQVCGYTCEDFCGSKSTAGECVQSEGGKCGWCESETVFGCSPVTANACPADGLWTAPGECSKGCAAKTDVNTCVAANGCFWCHEKGTCGSFFETQTCEDCDYIQLSSDADITCPGAVGDASSGEAVTAWCSGHGTCDWNRKACTCDVGWNGVACDLECGDCDIGGACGRDDGFCVCDAGKASGDDGVTCGEVGCAAADGKCMHGASCDTACGIVLDDSTSCSGIFNAGDGSCLCKAGFSGADCSVSCPGINQADGSGNACGPNGACVEATGVCECDPCYEPDASGICVEKASLNCGKGEEFCNAAGEKECACPGSLGGDGCTECACVNGGTCNSITSFCDCTGVFIGTYCETECSRDQKCSGKGDCNMENGICTCDEGWLGSDCNTPAFECTPVISGLYVTGLCDPVAKIDTATEACTAPVEGDGTYVLLPCERGAWDTLGTDTQFEVCTSPVGDFEQVGTACVQGNIHTAGSDTEIEPMTAAPTLPATDEPTTAPTTSPTTGSPTSSPTTTSPTTGSPTMGEAEVFEEDEVVTLTVTYDVPVSGLPEEIPEGNPDDFAFIFPGVTPSDVTGTADDVIDGSGVVTVEVTFVVSDFANAESEEHQYDTSTTTGDINTYLRQTEGMGESMNEAVLAWLGGASDTEVTVTEGGDEDYGFSAKLTGEDDTTTVGAGDDIGSYSAARGHTQWSVASLVFSGLAVLLC